MKTEFSSEAVEQWKALGPILSALGSTTRQKILLLFEPGEQLNIKKIADQFDLSRTAVVHHIGVLQDSGILKSERIGKDVVMKVDWARISCMLGKIQKYISAAV